MPAASAAAAGGRPVRRRSARAARASAAPNGRDREIVDHRERQAMAVGQPLQRRPRRPRPPRAPPRGPAAPALARMSRGEAGGVVRDARRGLPAGARRRDQPRRQRGGARGGRVALQHQGVGAGLRAPRSAASGPAGPGADDQHLGLASKGIPSGCGRRSPAHSSVRRAPRPPWSSATGRRPRDGASWVRGHRRRRSRRSSTSRRCRAHARRARWRRRRRW
jgi:hypothetical protein